MNFERVKREEADTVLKLYRSEAVPFIAGDALLCVDRGVSFRKRSGI